MFTYAIYNFILFGSTWVAYLYEKSKSRNSQIIFLTIAFLIPFVFLALRYNIGTDYHNYIDIYYEIKADNSRSIEPGYYWINYWIIYFDLGEHLQFVIIGFFTMLFAYKAFPKGIFMYSLFFFIAIFYLFYGYNAIRQGLAVSIMAYSMKYLHNKRFFPYLLWSLVAFSFHFITGLLLLLLYPFLDKKINRFIMIGVLIGMLFVVLQTNMISDMFKILALISPKYAYAATEKWAHGGGGLAGPMLKLLPIFVIIYFKDTIANKFKYANIFINQVFLLAIFIVFAINITLLDRVEGVFIYGLIFSLSYFLKTFEKQGRIIASYVVLVFYLLWFNRYVTIARIENNNSQHVSPYQTIFNKEGAVSNE